MVYKYKENWSQVDFEAYKQRRDLQKNNILTILRTGTMTIKEGRIMKGNPEGLEKIVNLTYGQIVTRVTELERLGGRVGDISQYPEHVQEVINRRKTYGF